MAKLALFGFLILNIWNVFLSKRTDSNLTDTIKITSKKSYWFRGCTKINCKMLEKGGVLASEKNKNCLQNQRLCILGRGLKNKVVIVSWSYECVKLKKTMYWVKVRSHRIKARDVPWKLKASEAWRYRATEVMRN